MLLKVYKIGSFLMSDAVVFRIYNRFCICQLPWPPCVVSAVCIAISINHRYWRYNNDDYTINMRGRWGGFYKIEFPNLGINTYFKVTHTCSHVLTHQQRPIRTYVCIRLYYLYLIIHMLQTQQMILYK